MKINSKLISERVDYFIDLMLECECEKSPDTNTIVNGDEPDEGEKQKGEIVDDIEEDLTLFQDDDEIDSEEDLNKKDGGEEENALGVNDDRKEDDDNSEVNECNKRV